MYGSIELQNEYELLLAGKVREAADLGIHVEALPASYGLMDFQDASVRWALRKGRAAIFADTGLGKTRMQLAWADSLVRYEDRNKVLILAPLAVGPQTAAEAELMGIPLDGRIDIANYESLHKIDVRQYAGVVLDESSILKNFTGKIKRQLVDAFAETPYRLCCTATPAPNDYEELGNHSEFLGIMPRLEMLTRWFLHDSANTADWRLKDHGRADYWKWLASWALCYGSPADIGFPETASRFTLPLLNIHEEIVSTEGLPAPPGELFRDIKKLSSTTMHEEMRITADRRADRVAEIVADHWDEPILIWVNTDYEAEAVRRKVGDIAEVKGSMSHDAKVKTLMAFSQGTERILLTKPKIAGFGMNWQHCARVIFMGISYSYEQFYQAIRRCWRFGQLRQVECHVVIADSEGSVLRTVQEKERAHIRMKTELQVAMRDVMDLNPERRVLRILGDEWKEAVGPDWRMVNDDCVRALSREPDNSIEFSVFSPPFSTLYIYSDSIADMGNTADDGEFFKQYGFLARELHRVMMPGRLVAVHCTDLPEFKWATGRIARKDFPGAIIREMEDAGFAYHSRVTIWKDPVVEMQRTKAHGLLYKELCKDSCGSRQGMADYVIVFRKWEGIEDAVPVNSGATERFYDYRGSTRIPSGEYMRGLTKAERDRLYSIAVWQRYASPVWFDIVQTDVLNKELARAEQDERHICPLQLGVIERCIELWSNPGDLVLSPFAGIGSEGYQAIKQGRRFLGIELKESYYTMAARHIEMGAGERRQMHLFDAPSLLIETSAMPRSAGA